MRNYRLINSACVIVVVLILSACSLTSHLPEGEILYTGIHSCKVVDHVEGKNGEVAVDAVKSALAAKPNGAIMGSSSIRNPFPWRLWVYNHFVNKKGKMGKWIFKHFSTKPVLISGVNPDMRVKVGENIMREYGYFRGDIQYELRYNKRFNRHKRKASLNYRLIMNEEFRYDSIEYRPITPRADSLIKKSMKASLIKQGDPFTYLSLKDERDRVARLLQNRGFYYLKSDMLNYNADTILEQNKVQLRLELKNGITDRYSRSYNIGKIAFYLNSGRNNYSDSLLYKEKMFYFDGRSIPVRPSVLVRQLRLKEGWLYSLRGHEQTVRSMNSLGIFSSTEVRYRERMNSDTLDVAIYLTLDDPINSELEFNFTTKSSNQIGPGAQFGVTKRNLFGGGETFSFNINGAYEWQTGKRPEGKQSAINSYELGTSVSLTVPRILFPYKAKRQFEYPATTSFRISAEQLNRARFFKMLSLSENTSYKFQTSSVARHTFTPFALSYNYLQHTTSDFDSIMNSNPALALGFQNQFLLSMGYNYTYDNSARNKVHKWFWETSITSAGTLMAAAYSLAGEPFTAQKKLFNVPFAQFVKWNTELHYNYKIDKNQSLAARLAAGIVYAYGEGGVPPYNEQFYVGGANSIRAFTIRSIGPGGYRPDGYDRYSYLDQTGDLKLEANLEYRFRLLGDLNGALFVDAGNCWLLKKDPDRPNANITLNNFVKQIALGTGVGLRYDLSFLVIRFDVGMALHVPYETTKSGYYNIPRFKDGLGFHLAIGYPF